MKRVAEKAIFVLILGLAVATAGALVALHFYARPHFIQQPGARMAGLPRITFWAWERSENFAASPITGATPYAVAYFDQTIEIAPGGVTARPRLQPVTFPQGATRIAVVRIEVAPGSPLSKPTLADTTRLLLASAGRPGISVFQVDYETRLSERSFYRTLLLRLRAAMPPALPLSITALPSWCAYDDWIHDLPIDEAVPMFFRMESEWGQANPNFADYQLREPLCSTAIGLSDHGNWPPITDGRRVYLFADGGWNPQAVKSALERIH